MVSEKVVASHLNSHINCSNTSTHYQSDTGICSNTSTHYQSDTGICSNTSTHYQSHTGNFTPLELPFLRSTMIFCLQRMIVQSRHWLCLTFSLPSIILTLLFSWKDLTIGFVVAKKAMDWFKLYLIDVGTTCLIPSKLWYSFVHNYLQSSSCQI